MFCLLSYDVHILFVLLSLHNSSEHSGLAL